MFAKLFGTFDSQVLIKIDRDEEEGNPEVRVYFEIPEAPETGVCSVAFQYPDTDEGWDNAEMAFKQIGEERARKLVADAASVYTQVKD